MMDTTSEFDAVLSLCQNQHRRIVIAVLAEEQQSTTLDDLIRAIVRYNHQMPFPEASDEIVTQIQISLHHLHLPKLNDAGLVEYYPEQQRVMPTEQFDQIQPLLSAIIEADPDLEESTSCK